MAGPNEELVRRAIDVINTSDSVDEVMAALEDFMDPEIEYVNPEDAIERGTRKGMAGMRTVLENFIAGAGAGATTELLEIEERGDRVFVLGRIHARGASSGAEALSPPFGTIYWIRGGRVIRIEWHLDVATARARFEESKN